MGTSKQTIPPFWQQLNKFFLYPFQKRIVLYAFYVAFVSYLFLWLVWPSSIGSTSDLNGANAIGDLVRSILFLFVIGLVTLFAIVRYGFKIAALCSLGIFDIEDRSAADEEGDWKNLPWKFVGVLLLQGVFLGFITQIFTSQAYILQYLNSFLISLAMPAVVMILIQKLSFWAALNPIELVRTIAGVGWPYVLLFGFGYLLNLGFQQAAILMFGAFDALPMWLFIPSLVLIYIYFHFVNMAMTGYTMYQYHQNLDFDVIHDYDVHQPQPTSPREIARQRDVEVAEMLQNGDTEDALLQAQDWLDESPESLAEHRRYHRVLRLAGSANALEKHGHEYIGMLLKQQSVSEALKTYKGCIDKIPEFALSSAVATVSLAQAAFKQQEHDTALNLLRGFNQRFAKHPLIPTAFALIVRILHQGLHQPKQAQAVLNSLQRLYPNDPHTQEAARVLQKS